MTLFIGDCYSEEWHIGQCMPSGINGRTVKLQADGDELAVIVAAIKAASKLTLKEKTKVVADRGYSLGDLMAICVDHSLPSIDAAIERVYQWGTHKGVSHGGDNDHSH